MDRQSKAKFCMSFIFWTGKYYGLIHRSIHVGRGRDAWYVITWQYHSTGQLSIICIFIAVLLLLLLKSWQPCLRPLAGCPTSHMVAVTRFLSCDQSQICNAEEWKPCPGHEGRNYNGPRQQPNHKIWIVTLNIAQFFLSHSLSEFKMCS